MAVHPFARKCEALIEKLREILASFRKAKEDKPDPDTVPLSKYGTLDDVQIITLLPSPQMEHQGAKVTGSTRGMGGKAPDVPKGFKGDPVGSRLVQKVQSELTKCLRRRIRENSSYYRCLAKPGGSGRSCKGLYVKVDCPGLEAARDALAAYLISKTPGGNSGGGGGGGW